MRTITQRELRNQSAAVMDAVERGETIRITRHGKEVAELRPVASDAYVDTASILHAFAGLPDIDLAEMRAQEDDLFGVDELESAYE